MAILITGISELITCDHTLDGADQNDGLGIVRDAAVVVGSTHEDAPTSVLWIGAASDAPEADWSFDLGGQAVLPGFVDSHSHLVYAGDRSAEFAARMMGQRYDGGGILTTVEATGFATDGELRALLTARIDEMHSQGTTTVEIKSGYGLDLEEEVRHLRLAREVTEETTFLGAHVVPPDYRDDRAGYVDLVAGPMMDAAAPYARWVDVFCEPHSPHAFDGEEARLILTAGADAGLGLRVHGNQLGPGPGVQLAVELGAASVDHCTFLSDTDIDALAGSPTVATLLPGVEFSTRSPYPDARRLIDAGVSVAIATDCNPGTCNSSSMPLMIALAVREMGMTPAEAVRAATVVAARSLQRTDIGVVQVGARADLAVVSAPSYLHIPYRVGVPIVKTLQV
ncbi:imidazolonepropionase [Ornithinimicrobium cryptoxanthini]|uniref:Imidazolonepropionase n=1 Tax=Ornithinimicrobium cryptoxanthini TaxID=2934161 RepID=A0ABY4YII1_9MICO|nr:imidazolonepropionase [Ornithinimicrobium cryptoxanthini]USQ76158.1 imidazolonepropionase [Ornithinimicrobium cryptoxanthini]